MEELLHTYGGAGSVLTLIGLLIINWWKSRNEKTRAQADAVNALSKALNTSLTAQTGLQLQLNALLEDRTAAATLRASRRRTRSTNSKTSCATCERNALRVKRA